MARMTKEQMQKRIDELETLTAKLTAEQNADESTENQTNDGAETMVAGLEQQLAKMGEIVVRCHQQNQTLRGIIEEHGFKISTNVADYFVAPAEMEKIATGGRFVLIKEETETHHRIKIAMDGTEIDDDETVLANGTFRKVATAGRDYVTEHEQEVVDVQRHVCTFEKGLKNNHDAKIDLPVDANHETTVDDVPEGTPEKIIDATIEPEPAVDVPVDDVDDEPVAE